MNSLDGVYSHIDITLGYKRTSAAAGMSRSVPISAFL